MGPRTGAIEVAWMTFRWPEIRLSLAELNANPSMAWRDLELYLKPCIYHFPYEFLVSSA